MLLGWRLRGVSGAALGTVCEDVFLQVATWSACRTRGGYGEHGFLAAVSGRGLTCATAGEAPLGGFAGIEAYGVMAP